MKGLIDRVQKLEAVASLENSLPVLFVRFVTPEGKQRDLQELQELGGTENEMRNDGETAREFTNRVREKYPDCKVFVEVLNDDDENDEEAEES
jgi:hypothetical protein